MRTPLRLPPSGPIRIQETWKAGSNCQENLGLSRLQTYWYWLPPSTKSKEKNEDSLLFNLSGFRENRTHLEKQNQWLLSINISSIVEKQDGVE